MKIAIVGTGYVGLVSGVCLAARGHDVACVDIRAEIVTQLNHGKPHIYEAGLPELLAGDWLRENSAPRLIWKMPCRTRHW